MPSLIQQLQTEALDQNIPVSQLLRKAKVIAIKLDLVELNDWIEKEMNGYKQGKDIPPYRDIYVELKGYNPHRGWQPVQFEDAKTQDSLNSRKISQEISGIEESINNPDATNLQIPLNAEAKRAISKGMNFQVELTHSVSRSTLVSILNAVRNTLLEWSLRLEKEGILGEDLSFSSEDKTKAHAASTIYNINSIHNFAGNMGAVSGRGVIKVSQTDSVDMDALRYLVDQLKKYTPDIPLESEQKASLEHEIAVVDSEIRLETPSQSRVRTALASARTALEGAAGNMIAQGALALIAKHLTN